MIEKIKPYIFLHVILLLYSCCSICSKQAALAPFLSFEFFLFYGLVIAILGVYAILWQQVLKQLPLTVAFANKAVTIIWGMIWGVVLFQEAITFKMVFGAAVVILGVVIVVTGGAKE